MALSLAELAVIVHDNHNDEHSPDLAGTELALRVLEQQEPESLGLIEYCVTTGHDESRKAARLRVRSVLDSVHHAYTGVGAKDGKIGWAYCRFLMGHHFVQNLMLAWSYNQVQQFHSFVQGFYDVGRIIDEEAQRLSDHGFPNLHDYFVNHNDWIGMAALVATGMDPQGFTPQQVQDFIEYAGTHNNIAAVIDTAAERKMIDLSTIEGLIHQRDVPTAMRCGTL